MVSTMKMAGISIGNFMSFSFSSMMVDSNPPAPPPPPTNCCPHLIKRRGVAALYVSIMVNATAVRVKSRNVFDPSVRINYSVPNSWASRATLREGTRRNWKNGALACENLRLLMK